MSDEILDKAFLILRSASSEKPWMTTRTIAKKMGRAITGKELESLLLSHCRECEENDKTPTVRYSGLPSRTTLEVLWGTTGKVGSRVLENITKDDIVDESLGDFETLKDSDVFFSHSHRDYEAVMEVAQLMLDQGVVPWLAETHIGQGEHIHDEIIRALDASQAFVLFLSNHALDSRWTGKEFSNASSAGIPIFVVLDFDWEEAPSICESIVSKQFSDVDLRGKFKGGARAFLYNLIGQDGQIAETFLYSRGPVPDSRLAELSPVKPLSALPEAILNFKSTGRAG